METIIAQILTVLAALFAHPAVVVDRSDHTVTVYAEETSVYPVGLGAPGWETPTGVYKVTGAYRTADPAGSYGPAVVTTTAVGRVDGDFNGAIALHGTNRPELVGGNPSHGCIRLLNTDIARVATTVEEGSIILIRD
jgi:lipoprotein-anchoring transpeptidase ErfK/SrfK